MLIHSATQLLTIATPPQKGSDLGQLNIIEDGAVLVRDGKIAEVGSSQELWEKYADEEQLDAAGRVVMPGFVDPHTHVVWAGDRAAEFEMRLQGKTYLEILEAGGGILSTVESTRAASLEQLVKETRPRLQSMFQHGATTIEAKTGYGLDLETETRMLEALLVLDDEGPWELAFTFLGAHAVPPEYVNKEDEYTTLVADEMLPALKVWWGEKAGERQLPFVDVFCETGAFSLAQTELILVAAKELGFPLKVHADEFDNLGGTALAVELGAASADHLVSISEKDVEALASGITVAVGLPGTPFGLAEGDYTPAKDILEAGGTLAIASDLNPGTAWCENIQFALALACRYMKLTPAQAIAAATINAAAAIGRHEDVGSVEAGKQADLLILDVPDYRHLGYRFGTNLVQSVIKEGVVYPND
ncbi:MAG: imidazolonepropionase [Chloroflexi bacterium]|nr:MAG: imidazolonepropionase [Chloroflexota bacterium]MBL1197468.1 imidazolonepropionase [Chloroflexota bacterium]NOH14763.1 imidazolonepropionase [Chloroflexota bacterium]